MGTRLVYTIPQVRDEMQLGNTKVYEEIKDGRLKAFKVGRRTLVTHDALMAYLKLCEQESNPPSYQCLTLGA